MPKLIDYYDAKKWDISEVDLALQRETKAIKLLRKHLKNTAIKVLDVGCGNGHFLQTLAMNWPKWKLFGVDYSKYKLSQAKKLPYEFKWCNLEKGIPYDKAFFDVVYSGEVIEHLYNPDFMLTECNRILKRGGLLVLSTPNLQAWYNRILFLLGVQPLFYETSTKSSMVGVSILRRLKKQDIPVGHLRVFNKCALKDLLTREGFEIIEIKGAIFQSLPLFLQKIDKLFNIVPSLASNLIVIARKSV